MWFKIKFIIWYIWFIKNFDNFNYLVNFNLILKINLMDFKR